MRDKFLQIRVSESERQRAHDKASIAGKETSAWVRIMLGIQDPVERPARKPKRPEQKEYRCPIMTCDYRAFSEAAVCGTHGRKVVESI